MLVDTGHLVIYLLILINTPINELFTSRWLKPAVLTSTQSIFNFYCSFVHICVIIFNKSKSLFLGTDMTLCI